MPVFKRKPVQHVVINKYENSPVKKSIDELLSATKKANTKGLPHHKAVIKLEADLKKHNTYLENAMKKANTAEGIPQAKYNKILINYAKKCEDSIYDNQPKIVAAGGNWNQFKAKVNAFLEQHTNFKKSMQIEGSGYNKSAVEAFNKAKETIKSTKDYPDLTDEPQSPKM